MAHEVIRLMDVAMDHRAPTGTKRWLHCQLNKKILGLASLQRTIARKQSRILWLKKGTQTWCFSNRLPVQEDAETTSSD